MSDKKNKPQSPLKLADIARELRRIADDLEKQRFATGAGLIEVTGPTFLKTRSELKGDSAYFSLSIRMGLADGTGETTPAASPAREYAPPRKERSSGSGEAKRVKKEINRLWKNLRRQIETRERPNPADGKGLLKLWEEYAIFAEAAWSEQWRGCKSEVERCLRSAAGGDWPEAEAAAGEVLRLTKECHRQHK
ncbi:MAG: hypothetical protein OEV73_11195 [Desulfobulbaceae bacterium]|nr:hypothetical protein [Desulfobulbaceae bacterium]